MLSFLFWPFAACFILAGIHTYLGIHVIRRGVIFVDLALAQLAALGASLAVLFGFELHDPQAYFLSLGMTIAGALYFSFLRYAHELIPQEAVIGVAYVVSAAASLIVLDQAPGGAEHVRALLVGNILTVSKVEVIRTMFLYAVLGGFYWLFRKQMMSVSFETQTSGGPHRSVRWWDFFFYTTFGIVVTSSVALAGILLVFSYLIVPALLSLFFSENIYCRLLIGWGIGLVASLGGLWSSVIWDLPTGAAIVCVFGFLFFGIGFTNTFWPFSRS